MKGIIVVYIALGSLTHAVVVVVVVVVVCAVDVCMSANSNKMSSTTFYNRKLNTNTERDFVAAEQVLKLRRVHGYETLPPLSHWVTVSRETGK